MAITKEIWVSYIVGNLFRDNPHLTRCRREDEYVVGQKIVHIPQAGAKPTVVKNRSSYPAAAVRRTDQDIVYLLDEYTTDPTHIPNIEEAETSYNKMDSVLGEHISTIAEMIGDETIIKWLQAFSHSSAAAATAAAQVIRTLGADVASHMPGSTGNRKLFTKESLKKARTILNKDNISKERRVALLSSDILSQLQDDTTLQARDMAKELDMTNGVITRLYGFDIIERSWTAAYDNAGTPVVKALGAASAVTDNDAAVCYQEDHVALAMGQTKIFENLDDPQNYGDIYSALTRSGARKRRYDGKGIVSIVQAAA